MQATNNIFVKVADALVASLEELLFILELPEQQAVAVFSGWGFEINPSGLSSFASTLTNALDTIRAAPRDVSSIPAVLELLASLSDLHDDVVKFNDLVTSFEGTRADAVFELSGRLLLKLLWRQRGEALLALLALGLVEPRVSSDFNIGGGVSRSSGYRHLTVRPDGLTALVRGSGGITRFLDGQAQAENRAVALGEALSQALEIFGERTFLDSGLWWRDPGLQLSTSEGLTFTTKSRGSSIEFLSGSRIHVGVGVLDAGVTPKVGILLAVEGEAQDFSLGGANITFGGQGSLIIDEDGSLYEIENGTTVEAGISTIKNFSQGPFSLGIPGVVGLESSSYELSISVALNAISGDLDVDAEIRLPECLLSVTNTGSDGFLQRLLPNGISSKVAVGVGLGTQKGFYLINGNGLEVELPLHVGLDGIKLTDFSAAISESNVEIAGNVAAEIGPVAASIEKLGLRSQIAVSSDGGNAGLVDIQSLEIRPPTGAGLTIEAGAVTGGGYLFFDTDAQEYGGAVELSFQSFGLAAVGLITTKMPDGSDGFSMMVIISAEFSAVQLGFGFTLTGVGGLLGINRQADVQALRSNMKSGGLNSIMFPENVVENAQRIVSDVGAAFPVAEGNHVFGPILRIGWGTPTLFELTMGVVLSFPSPFKVVLLGRFELALPSLEFDGEVPPVWIKVDFLGVIDPAGGVLSLDGVLYDSRLLGYSLEGQFAMQQTFGDDPKFLVSIGGFHPNFEPPPRVPDLKRLSLTLGNGGNPRLRNELYKAVTSNTFQMGARVEAYAKKAGFTVLGTAGYDALVIFSPFGLDVSFYIRGHVKKDSKRLLSLDIKLNLTGPDPWRAKGRASFEVLFITVKVRFNLTFGDSGTPKLPETDVLEKLTSALEETRNWSVKLPNRTREPVVMFRELPADTAESLLHPESSLTVRQKVVPLGFDIERYSGAIPTANEERVRRFEIDSLDLNGTTYSASQPELVTEEKEKFAPGVYLKLSDEEKLSRPSFESFTAGATLAGSQGYSISGSTESVDTTYEQSVVDTSTGFAFDFQGVLPPQSVQAAHAQIFSQVADDSGTDSSVYQPEKLGIRVDDPAYTVAAKDDAGRMANIPADTNFYEANKALEDSGQSTEDYHVVLTHEEKAA